MPPEVAAQATLKAATSERQRCLVWARDLAVAKGDAPSGKSRAERIIRCGQMMWAYNPTTKGHSHVNLWCRDRMCPACAAMRSRKLTRCARERMARFMAERDRSLFAMMTLTHVKKSWSAESAGEAVTRFLTSWRKLVNRRPFKRMVRGWIRCIEVVWSTKSGYAGWHAHAHVMLDIKPEYRDEAWQTIRDLWLDITKGAAPAQNFKPFHFKRGGKVVRSSGELEHEGEALHVLGQVIKYITKPFDLPLSRGVAFFRDMAGRRMLASSGTWKGFEKELDEESSGFVPQSLHVAQVATAALANEVVTAEFILQDGEPRQYLGGSLQPGEVLIRRRHDAASVLRAIVSAAAEDARARDGPSSRAGTATTEEARAAS